VRQSVMTHAFERVTSKTSSPPPTISPLSVDALAVELQRSRNDDSRTVAILQPHLTRMPGHAMMRGTRAAVPPSNCCEDA